MKKYFIIFLFAFLAVSSCSKGIPSNNLFDEYIFLLKNDESPLLTINSEMQKDVYTVMKNHKVPYGVVLVADCKTGKILTAKEYSTRGYKNGEYINTPLVASSIFKIVSLSAAIGSNVLNPSDKIPFYDRPYSELNNYMAKRNKKVNKSVISIRDAMAMSNNSAFAEIGLRINNHSKIVQYAKKLFFTREKIRGINTGYIDSTKTKTEQIQLYSGLRYSYMSPFHALLIAMTLGNRGTLVFPMMNSGDKQQTTQVLKKEVADGVLKAMSATTTSGTSKRTFSANKELAAKTFAKTGSLTGKNPSGYYNWFLGVYKGKNTNYAVVVLTVNDPKWSVKANYVAYKTIEFIRKYVEN